MISHLSKCTVNNDNDLVRILDGRESMSDDNKSNVSMCFPIPIDGILNSLFVHFVKGRGCLV